MSQYHDLLAAQVKAVIQLTKAGGDLRRTNLDDRLFVDRLQDTLDAIIADDPTVLGASPFDRHRQFCADMATTWDRAAEAARVAGNLSLANSCAQRAIRCWYLAEYDPDVEDIYNTQGEVDGSQETFGRK